MPYDSVVCVKQVPDTANVTAEAMKDDGTVNRSALPAIFNPEDLHALESALEVRDRFGGTVTAITMGPPKAGDVLRECLFRGADRAILLTDFRAAASDTLATSYIIAQAVKTIGRYDLVFCGRQAIDGDTAQVGPQLAEKLGFNLVTYVERLEALDGRTVRARRSVGSGWEVVSCDLPALLTVMETANTPRPPSARRMMKYKKARSPSQVRAAVAEDMPDADDDAGAAEAQKRCAALGQRGLLIEEWSLDDMEADLAWCGRDGSPTKVHRIQSVVLAGGEYHEYQRTDEAVAELIGALIEDHTLG